MLSHRAPYLRCLSMHSILEFNLRIYTVLLWSVLLLTFAKECMQQDQENTGANFFIYFRGAKEWAFETPPMTDSHNQRFSSAEFTILLHNLSFDHTQIPDLLEDVYSHDLFESRRTPLRTLWRTNKNTHVPFLHRQQMARHILTAPLNESNIRRFLLHCTQRGLRCEMRHRLTWLNAISVRIHFSTPLRELHNALDAIQQQLHFILEWKPVQKLSTVAHDPQSSDLSHNISPRRTHNSIFGATHDQLHQIGSTTLQEKYNLTGANVTVLLLDSGFDWRYHQALASHVRIKDTWDFVRNNSIVWQEDGDHPQQYIHGTKVLGVIAGKDDFKYYGSAYNAEFLLAKTENIPEETRMEEDHLVAALIWGHDRGAQVVSVSLGYSFDPFRNGVHSVATRGVNAATALGMVCVISVGNEGRLGETSLTVPADAFLSIAVGAVNQERNLATFSSQGPTSDGRIKPEVVALGVSNALIDPSTTNGLSVGSGSSFSAPLVAGLVAQLVQGMQEKGLVGRGGVHVAYIRALLLRTAQGISPEGVDNVFGWGLPQGVAAYSALCDSVACMEQSCAMGQCACFEGHVGEYCLRSSGGNGRSGSVSTWCMVCMLILYAFCELL